MTITPNSIIKVLSGVPLDANHRNVIHFGDRASQTSYFTGKSKYTFSNYSYVREQRKIRVGVKADSLFDCNYLMYQNTGFGTKWFYAFITGIEYVSNEVSEISFVPDEFQTWLLNADYTIKPSFVEREHVSDDSIGANIIDEKLEYGEYVYKEYQKSNMFNNLAFVVAISDMSPILGSLQPTTRMYDNMASGLVYWVFQNDSVSNMSDFLKLFDDAGKKDAIEMIFTIPYAFLPHDGQLMTYDSTKSLTWTYSTTHTDIDGYVPKNKKLFTYPYNVLSISNNMGKSAQYRFEDFLVPDNILFTIESHIAPNPVVVLSPRNFKKHTDFNSLVQEYCLTLDNYPLCSWNTDIFRNWVAQNGLSVIGGTVGGIAGAVGGIMTGNIAVAGAGLYSIFNQLSQTYKASLTPDQAQGNIKNGSFNIAHNRQDFYLMHMTIKNEYARVIDDYLSMFGYKVNEVKVPNISTRPHWNYVKTIDVTITGDIPADAKLVIEGVYNNGVTFWKSASEVGNYDLDNSI